MEQFWYNVKGLHTLTSNMNFSRSYVLKSGVHYKDDNVLMNVISNINWSEWSTIQGVISKSDDRTPSARPI